MHFSRSPNPLRPRRGTAGHGVGLLGFTLIEVLIVVCLISLLAMLAMPSYTSYLQRAQRAQAQAAMLRLAQWMERVATANGTYPPGTSVPAVLLNAAQPHYTLQIEVPDPQQPGSVQSFRIVARRSAQASPDACGDLVLDQTGQRGLQGAANANLRHCWNE